MKSFCKHRLDKQKTPQIYQLRLSVHAWEKKGEKNLLTKTDQSAVVPVMVTQKWHFSLHSLLRVEVLLPAISPASGAKHWTHGDVVPVWVQPEWVWFSKVTLCQSLSPDFPSLLCSLQKNLKKQTREVSHKVCMLWLSSHNRESKMEQGIFHRWSKFIIS